MGIPVYNNDKEYKIEYGRTINKFRFRKNWVGPQSHIDIEVADYAYSNINSVFINSATGSDITGTGIAASAYATMLKGGNSCTGDLTRAIIQNSALYAEDLSTLSNSNFEGYFAASGQTPTYTLRTLGFTPSDANSIFVAATGSDSASGGSTTPKLTMEAADAAASGGKYVVIQDSEEYDMTARTMVATGWCAALDQTPTIKINQNIANNTLTPFTIATTDIDTSAACTYPMIAKFDDDSYVVAWVLAGDSYFAMYNNNDYCYKTKTAFHSAGSIIYACFVLPISQNVVFLSLHSTTNDLYYAVYDKTGTVVKANTLISAMTCVAAHGAAYSDDTWIVAWCDSAALYAYYYATFDSTGTAVKTKTYIAAGAASYCSLACGIQSNDTMVFAYTKNVSGLYLTAITNDGMILTNKLISSSVVGDNPSLVTNNGVLILDDDSIVVFYCANGAQYRSTKLDYQYNVISNKLIKAIASECLVSRFSACKIKNDDVYYLIVYPGYEDVYFGILNKDIEIVFSEVKIEDTSPSNYISSFINNNAEIIYCRLGTSNYLSYARLTNYYFIGVNLNTAATINGITFDCENQDYLKYVIAGSGNLTRKFCEFENQSSTYFDEYANLTPQKIALLTGQLDRRYEYIHDCNNGDDVTNTVAKFYNNIFINCVGVDATVTGTAASADYITYRHNAVQSAGGGFHITGNGGTNETIYDNIFDNVSGYDMSAAVALTARNCISTGENNNVTLDDTCETLNPLFLNSGALGSEFADLDLKSTDMGDFASSPGLLMASGGVSNVGPYDTLIIGPADSWSTFTAIKPVDGIQIKYGYANTAKIQKDSGAYGSSFRGFAYQVIIKHDGMTNAVFADLINLIRCGSNEVRFYGDPATSPSVYVEGIFLYESFDGFSKNYRNGGFGKQNVQITIGVKYV